MILFFPQYQAGAMPSTIPVGTPSLRKLWQAAPDFVEVPLQETDAEDSQSEGGIHYRKILTKQLLDARAIVDAAQPESILVTGGDCGASFVSIDYTNVKYDGKIGVIWVDSHGDIHTPSTSPSGHYHGMVLRNLMGDESFDVQPRMALKPEQIAYLGLQDTEKEEDEIIARLGIQRFNSTDIMQGDAAMDAVIARFKSHGITHLYLHVDCDVMDEKEFPHVHVPEPKGISLERLLYILKYLRTHMPVAGRCLTEYAPRTEGAGLDIIKRVYTEGLGLALPA